MTILHLLHNCTINTPSNSQSSSPLYRANSTSVIPLAIQTAAIITQNNDDNENVKE